MIYIYTDIDIIYNYKCLALPAYKKIAFSRIVRMYVHFGWQEIPLTSMGLHFQTHRVRICV